MQGLASQPNNDDIAPAAAAQAQRIMIIERDPDSVQRLQNKLSQAGFTVITLHGGEDARAAIDRDSPHLVVIDWDQPAVVTMGLVQHIRDSTPARRARLIALSNFAGEQQVVTSFELGVDDYVVKPFSAPEVVARVRAVLRPMALSGQGQDFLQFHEIGLDPHAGRVIVKDEVVYLRGTEFRLLEFLMSHPERAFSRALLLRRVWGRESKASERAVDVNIQRLRRTLMLHGCDGYLQTIRCLGYRLSASPLGNGA